MNIGIIVHSHTGNTRAVANRLEESLSRAGHDVKVERLEVVGGEQPSVRNFQLAFCPDVSSYDVLIFGSPVRGASMSPVIAAYLKQLPTLKGKRVLCFVTMAFPFAWMGGTNAIGKMRTASEAKGATVCGTGIIRWSGKGRDERIGDVVAQFCRILES